MHDSMLLAGLINLAASDNDRPQSLADAVQQYCGYALEKEEYRTRYSETIGADWQELDSGFFEYAIVDAISYPSLLYGKLQTEAQQLVERLGTGSKSYGFFTEGASRSKQRSS